MNTTLPVYEMRIAEGLDSELEVSAIALVDSPAIEKNWLAFNENKNKLHFAEINNDEQIIVGAAMIPELLIYRNDPKLGGYNVVFSKDTVKKIAEKYYARGFQNKANLMHDEGQQVTGVNYFLSWIKDDAKGMVGLSGDYPDGTWFVGAKVTNPDVWAKIKTGAIKGFSVEGTFEYTQEQQPAEAETTLQKIKEILNGIKI